VHSRDSAFKARANAPRGLTTTSGHANSACCRRESLGLRRWRLGCGLAPDRVGRHSGKEDHATLDANEGQDIEAPERDSADVKEVAGKGARGLGSQEL
jgi:hypothetical protein